MSLAMTRLAYLPNPSVRRFLPTPFIYSGVYTIFIHYIHALWRFGASALVSISEVYVESGHCWGIQDIMSPNTMPPDKMENFNS